MLEIGVKQDKPSFKYLFPFFLQEPQSFNNDRHRNIPVQLRAGREELLEGTGCKIQAMVTSVDFLLWIGPSVTPCPRRTRSLEEKPASCPWKRPCTGGNLTPPLNIRGAPLGRESAFYLVSRGYFRSGTLGCCLNISGAFPVHKLNVVYFESLSQTCSMGSRSVLEQWKTSARNTNEVVGFLRAFLQKE